MPPVNLLKNLNGVEYIADEIDDCFCW